MERSIRNRAILIAAIFAMVLSVFTVLSLMEVNADMGGIGSPSDGKSYKLGETILLDVQPTGQITLRGIGIKGTIQVKRGSEIKYSKDVSTDGTVGHIQDYFTPDKAGTYTMVVDLVYTLSGVQIDTSNYKVTFHVIRPALKQFKPALTAERTSKKQAVLKWNGYTGAKAKIYRATKKNGKYKLIKTTSKTKYTDKKLSAKKTYYYKVRLTKKKNGKTTYSKYSSKVKVAPYSPFEVTLSKTSNGIRVKWGRYTSLDEGYYLLDKGTKNDGSGEVIGCYGLNETSMVDTDVKKGTTYYYRITVWHGNEDKPRAKTKIKKITF